MLRSCLIDRMFNESVCSCNNYFVRTGVICDKTTMNLNIFRMQIGVNFIFGLQNVIKGLNYLVHPNNSAFSATHLKKQKLVVILQTFGNIFFLISYLFLLPSLLLHDHLQLKNIVCANETVEKVLSKNYELILLFAFSGLALTTLGSFILILSWFEVLKDMSLYFPKLWDKKEEALEKVLYSSFPSSLVITFVLLLTGKSNLTWFVSGFSFAILFGGFSYLMWGFNRKLLLLSQDSKNMKKVKITTRRIKKRFVQLMLLLVGSAFLFVCSSIFTVKCRNEKPNENINQETFFRQLAYCCFMIQTVICFKEVSVQTKTMTKIKAKSQETKFSQFKSQKN